MADHRTRWVCTLAALMSLTLVATSTPALRLTDLPFLLFLPAPYLALELLVWSERGRGRLSQLLFVAVLLLSLAGVTILALDSYRFHTLPEHRMVQRMAVITVPMLQSLAVISLALVLQAYRMLSGRGPSRGGRSRRS